MSLRPTEAQQVVDELNRQLSGAVVQSIFAPSGHRAWLELRVPGRSALLSACASAPARLSVVDERPKGEAGKATGFQQLLRRELVGAKWDHASVEAQTISLHFTRQGSPLQLIVELPGALLWLRPANPSPSPSAAKKRSEPAAPQTAAPWRVVGASDSARVGKLYEPAPSSASAAPSRLKPSSAVDFPLARAAEALFAADERRTDEKAAQAPVLKKLKRLRATLAKVEEEAQRQTVAEQHRRDGELLSRNAQKIARGAGSVTLTEYQADGSQLERVVKLDPRRTVKQQADWHFHQYKRFTRGVELARARLERLREEEAGLIRALDAPPEEKAASHPRQSQPTLSERKQPAVFHTYRGWNDQPIWVGKGAVQNGELTFKLARPHHVWLHARGVVGAHVVIPLEKNVELPTELLLDAAHLAHHHSARKNEPRGEVTYTFVKYVRKAKAAGAVTYTQDKTFWLRVEPRRLQKLLASAEH